MSESAASSNDAPSLKRVEFLVLSVLTDGERHGYGIVQDVVARTEGAVSLRPGNLYRVLDRLMARGLVEEGDAAPVTHGGAKRRRFYRITPQGVVAVSAEARLLMQVVSSSDVLNASVKA
jgi:DNA-binding PadR family transcriptional regulator